MQQGHKLDSNPQHLEYMATGWEITISHQPNSGNLSATGRLVYWTQFLAGNQPSFGV